MINPLSRPTGAEIYEAIITGDQNPVQLRFPFKQEAEYFMREFFIGLEEHNDDILAEINYVPTREYKEQILLTFWR